MHWINQFRVTDPIANYYFHISPIYEQIGIDVDDIGNHYLSLIIRAYSVIQLKGDSYTPPNYSSNATQYILSKFSGLGNKQWTTIAQDTSEQMLNYGFKRIEPVISKGEVYGFFAGKDVDFKGLGFRHRTNFDGNYMIGRVGAEKNISLSTPHNFTKATEQEFVIYPNPSRGAFAIEYSKEFKQYSIMDISGKLIGSGALSPNGKQDIVIEDSGIYFIRIENDDMSQTKRLIVVGE